MIGKKINQLATELAPAATDLTIIGDPTTGVSKKITLEQISSLFGGSVSFYSNLSGFPSVGNIDIIYCAKDTKKLYLWSGSAYVEVFPSQALLDTYQLRSEKGNANGYASLDSQGKVPISQLPSSIMEYKGTWNASTNTPTLANGTGDTGDVYICNVAGTVNFGAGPLTFAVGDYVIYSGSIWQRSSGAVGTVTSVAASITGNAIGITGSPVTTSGTLAFAFAGTSAQYVNGAGNLITFPSIITQAQNLVTEVYNKTGATLTKGTVVYINSGQGNLPAVTKAIATGDSTSAQTYGIVQADITNMNNGYVVVAGRITDLDTQAYTEGTQLYLSSTTAGTYTSTKQYAPAHLVYVGIVVRAHPTQGVIEVKIQNGYEMDELHNVSAQTPSNNDGLFWEASTSLWKNKSISTILGYTPQAQLNGTGFVKASGTTITYDNSTYVTTDTFQTISASKTFSVGLSLASAGSTNQLTSFVNTSSIHSGSASTNVLGFNNSNNIYFGKGLNNGGVITFNNAAVRFYALPDADGTIALTSNIPSLTGYVPYTGATTNLNLGTYDLLSKSVYIEGTSSFQAGLLMKQYSFYNFVSGSYTQIAPSTATELNIVHNQANTTRRRYALSVAGLQDGDSFQYLVPRKDGTFAMTSDIPSLSGYVQGMGTTNYLPKFTGASTIGNSQIYDNGTNVGIGTASPNGKLTLSYSSSLVDGLIFINTASGGRQWRIGDGSGASAGSFGFYDATASATRLQIDASGNLGLGVTPSAWGNAFKAIQVGGVGSIMSSSDTYFVSSNSYIDASSNRTYITTGYALEQRMSAADGQFQWKIAPSGTAGNAISFTQAMTLNASGNLSIGNTNDTYKLDVSGTARFIVSSTSQNQLRVYSSDGTATLKSYSTSDGDGLILNQYYAVAGNPYLRSADFVASMGDVSSTQMRFFTKAYSSNPAVALTLASTGAATYSSSVTAQTNLGFINTNASQAGFVADYTGTGAVKVSMSTYNDIFQVYNETSGYSIFNFKPSTKAFVINPTGGNVGIGTTSPSEILHLKSTNNAAFIRFENTGGNGVYIGGRDNNIEMYTNSSEKMRVMTSGNVGIGITNPGARLVVSNNGGTGYEIDPAASSGTIVSLFSYDRANALWRATRYSGLDHRFEINGTTEAMRIKSTGVINLSNVPSSSAGLASGDVYKTVAGVLMIV
jgi:hypothetical protein